MKKRIWLLVIVILILFGIFLFLRSNEDEWVKDPRGVWIKHGNPEKISEEVLQQIDAINCANALYEVQKQNGINFNSQCLGKCKDYSIDIVHVPRIDEDNKLENQCLDFRNKVTKYFIELDSKGNIVRIFD